ncbi:MAG TPA: ornithine carbamoyltransferase, partial [Alphaproteobacteria bacterium]
FINLSDIPAAILKSILKDAHAHKKSKMEPEQILHGLTVAMIFDKESTRTRVSFETGVGQLGGHTLFMNAGHSQMGNDETIADTSRVMSRYVDALVLRLSKHEDVEEFAKYATIPVINAMTNKSHPCQIMADMMTIEEYKGSIDGLKIAFLGDLFNVPMTFIEAAEIFNYNLSVAVPNPTGDVQTAKNVTFVKTAEDAVKGADVVVTDTWVSMGQGEKDLTPYQPFQVNAALMAKAKPDAIFMHCLPAHRGHEVTNEVLDGPQSVVFDEAENRLHVQKSIMAWCLQNAGVTPKSKL